MAETGIDTACHLPDRALAAAVSLQTMVFTSMKKQSIALPVTTEALPVASIQRLLQPEKERGTVLYLAYGSNLSVETFRVKRGIKPLAQVNVQVPSLRLTFDLRGVPYNEPCFANSGLRDEHEHIDSDYHKDAWHKGLVGVVYELTPADHAHVIRTEGGGSGYQDILVDCHPFESVDPTMPVPETPTTKPFKAHTLFAPADRSDEYPSHDGTHRPDPGYAQPSARYLKLITDGAAELGLPYEYQDYLHAIRHFRITTTRQRLGQIFFTSLWLPLIMVFFRLSALFADKNGLIPPWLRSVSRALFATMWWSYDTIYKPVFGEGERSIPDGGDPSMSYKDEKFAVRHEQMQDALILEKAAATTIR